MAESKNSKRKKKQKQEEEKENFLYSKKFRIIMTIICFICFYAVGIYEIMSNDYENEQNRTYSHIENDMYLPQYMKDLLKPPPKNLRPESEYYRSGTGYSRHWSALGDIEKMIMVFVAGFFIATLFFFTALDEEK